MSNLILSRRKLITTGLMTYGGLMLAGCEKVADSLSDNAGVQNFLGKAEKLTYASQRFTQSRTALVPEFSEADISPIFKANGTMMPNTTIYQQLLGKNFTDWRLQVDGLVENPLSLSLSDIQALPARTQITRHDCVEGWSAIGKWKGPQLGPILKVARLKPNARYVIFHCADDLDAEPNKGGEQSPGIYYESIDLIDAFHPQTILAHTMNDKILDVKHGAPLRLRVERQLGYKQAKYLLRIEAVESFAHFSGGHGGYWPDRGYEWYAGI